MFKMIGLLTTLKRKLADHRSAAVARREDAKLRRLLELRDEYYTCHRRLCDGDAALLVIALQYAHDLQRRGHVESAAWIEDCLRGSRDLLCAPGALEGREAVTRDCPDAMRLIAALRS